MAITTTTPTTPTTSAITPSTGGLNYADYLKKIQTAAASTKEVSGIDTSAAKLAASKVGSGLQGTYAKQAGAAVQNFQQQADVTQKEATKAATGLEMMGTSTLQGMQNLDALQASIRAKAQSVSEEWGAAAEKADDYVKAARDRVGAVLSKIDEINTQIATDRDFSKAHSMQVAVQSSLGEMKTAERNIAENYGVDSKEFMQFQESKRTSLATLQSSIHANYAQLQEQQGITYLNAVSDAYTKSNMYVGFQEQQHVEMLKFKEESKNSYALQASQLEVSIEQLKMQGMENLANWIIETPTFSIDSTPMIALISDLVTSQKDAEQAYDLTHPQTKVPGSTRPSSGMTYSPGSISELNQRAEKEKQDRTKALY